MKNEVNRAMVAKKRFIALLLAIVASVGTMFAESGTCGDNLTWDLTNGVLTISGTGAMTNWSSASDVPWYSKRSSITEVSIPNSVTSIGESAFYECTGLTSVTIPNSVTSIGNVAFAYCSGLTSITIPNSVTSIGGWAFGECSGLTSVTIPNSVTSIGMYAFYDCYALTSITIPNSVTSIGGSAFNGCSGLTSITIPNGITSIEWRAFEGCSKLTSITIPNSVTSIGMGAFGACSGLTSITIPNSVTNIGESAFEYCSGLTSIEIPNSVTSIGKYAFYNCTGLTSVTWNVKNGDAASRIFGTQVETFIFGEEVEVIPTRLCEGMSKLTSVTIPNSVTSIGEWAFSGCSGLTSVTWNAKNCNSYYFGEQVESFVFGNEVEVIPAELCMGMSKLTSVTIPNSVTSIGQSAFRSCSGLTSVTIPNSVKSIGESAFDYCSSLEEVHVSDLTAWCSIEFADMGSNPLNEAHHLYLNNTEIIDLVIPSNIASIGNYAFSGCSYINSITISNNITNIGICTFRNCIGLTSVTIPNSITSIPNSAFSGCSGLTSVTIPNSVTSIEGSAFYECTSLTAVNLPYGVESIGNGAFAFCTGLTSITIPNSVSNIELTAFWGCTGLESIVVESGNKTYDSRNNSNAIIETASNRLVIGFKNTIIPNTVTSIGEKAFYWCTGLKSITIPNSVTSIGKEAFSGCDGLTSITCEAVTPPTCDTYVFDYVPKTIPLYVPAGSVVKYKAADQWKDFGDNIKPIQAEQVEVVEPNAEPTTNSVVIEWPKKDDAVSYTIVIKKGTETICTMTFNADGQLTGKQFAPSRHGEPQQAPMATLTATGWQYTVSGLEPDTDYKFLISVKNSADVEIYSNEVPFKTKNIPTGIDQGPSDQGPRTNKIIRNGMLLIEKNGKFYNALGKEVK